MRPVVGNLPPEGSIEMHAQALGKVFRCGFEVGTVRASADRHDPFQRIVAGCPLFLIMNEAQNRGFVGSPIRPLNGQKPFCVAIT